MKIGPGSGFAHEAARLVRARARARVRVRARARLVLGLVHEAARLGSMVCIVLAHAERGRYLGEQRACWG